MSVLVLGIGIAGGQYYWVLDIGCLSWYRSNPSFCITFTRISVLIHMFPLRLYCMQGSLNANTDKGRTGLRNLGNTVRMRLLSFSKS